MELKCQEIEGEEMEIISWARQEIIILYILWRSVEVFIAGCS